MRRNFILTFFVVWVSIFTGCAPRYKFAPVEVDMTVRVCIVDSQASLPRELLAAHPFALGAAYHDGRIYVVGQVQRGRLVLDRAIVGHEILHVLSWQTNGWIKDPDL